MFSCSEENLDVKGENNGIDLRSSDSNGQNTLLFNRLAVYTDENGDSSFTSDEAEVEAVIKTLFTQDNQLISRINDYGLGKEETTNRPYFYVKELTNPGSVSIFIYIDENGDSDSIIGGIKCVSVTCCADCIIQNGTCSCHKVDCADPWEEKPNCSSEPAAIHF